MNVTPFEAYKKYLAIKLHFTSKSYDYFKFGGAVKANQESFERRNDRYFFVKVARKFDDKTFVDYLVANFIDKDKVWIGELLGDEGTVIYRDWQKKIESLTYFFKEDLNLIKEEAIRIFGEQDTKTNFNLMLIPNKGQHPPILRMVMAKEISLETFLVLHLLLDLFPKYDKKIDEHLIWPDFKMKCVKYLPFIASKVERENLLNTLKKVLLK